MKLQAGEVIDAATMNVENLCAFYEREISDAKENDILLSLVRWDHKTSS
jgi:isocitrate dehydrogenase